MFRTFVLSLTILLGLGLNVIAQPTTDIEIIQNRVCLMLDSDYTIGETILSVQQMIIASREGRLAGRLTPTQSTYTDQLLQESQQLIEKNDQITAKNIVMVEIALNCRQYMPLIEQLSK